MRSAMCAHASVCIEDSEGPALHVMEAGVNGKLVKRQRQVPEGSRGHGCRARSPLCGTWSVRNGGPSCGLDLRRLVHRNSRERWDHPGEEPSEHHVVRPEAPGRPRTWVSWPWAGGPGSRPHRPWLYCPCHLGLCLPLVVLGVFPPISSKGFSHVSGLLLLLVLLSLSVAPCFPPNLSLVLVKMMLFILCPQGQWPVVVEMIHCVSIHTRMLIHHKALHLDAAPGGQCCWGNVTVLSLAR